MDHPRDVFDPNLVPKAKVSFWILKLWFAQEKRDKVRLEIIFHCKLIEIYTRLGVVLYQIVVLPKNVVLFSHRFLGFSARSCFSFKINWIVMKRVVLPACSGGCTV